MHVAGSQSMMFRRGRRHWPCFDLKLGQEVFSSVYPVISGLRLLPMHYSAASFTNQEHISRRDMQLRSRPSQEDQLKVGNKRILWNGKLPSHLDQNANKHPVSHRRSAPSSGDQAPVIRSRARRLRFSSEGNHRLVVSSPWSVTREAVT